MERRYLPRVLAEPGGGAVIIPATLYGSSATEALSDLDRARAEELTEAATRGGGLWVVQGSRWDRVVTAEELLAEDPAYLDDRAAPRLFEGAAPRALVHDDLRPVDLLVPIAGWDPGRAFYFHSDSPYFATVPVVRKRNHRVTVARGLLDDADRKLVGRRMVDGQTCGVLRNELGGLCVVPDGETATDVRGLYAERFRFIVDGLRELRSAAALLEEWAERFAAAADAGWTLERPIDNSFLYTANRRRLRTMLPLPAPGALVPVGVAVGVPGPGSGADGERAVSGLPDVATAAVLAAAAVAEADDDGNDAEEQETGDGAAAARASARAAEADRAGELARALIERKVGELLTSAVPDPFGAADRHPPEDTLAVLRRNVFRRPRGRLLRDVGSSNLVRAIVRLDGTDVTVLQGRLSDEVTARVAATAAENPALVGEFGVCHGAFGDVLAEVGSPLRAVQSMTSSMSYAHLLDGMDDLADAARRLGRVADDLNRLADEGWTLRQPIAGFWLRLRPPLHLGD